MTDRFGIYFDGAWQESSDPSATIEVVNPYSQEVIGRTSRGTAHDVAGATKSAHRALTTGPWPETVFAERAAFVERLIERLGEQREFFASLTSQEMGSPIASGRGLYGSIELVSSFLAAARTIDFAEVRWTDAFGGGLVERRPVGVVAGISPWNAPLRSSLKKAVPAILAGCTVVLKPAPETPFEAMHLAELLTELGLPPGVVNVVPGDRDTGEALVADPRVRKVAFTGSTRAGRAIAESVAGRFTRLQLELGGKSAALVLDDVDARATGKRVASIVFRNSGQVCTATTRALVPRDMVEEFLLGAADAAAAEQLGDPLDEATTMGPLVSEAQLSRVLLYLESAKHDGARIVAGGGNPSGWFIEPTVLADVNNSMQAVREEIFGPVLAVMPYDDLDEAIDIANDSEYGLHGAVYSENLGRAVHAARRIDSGTIAINGIPHSSALPFGGVKDSGVGREMGPEGIEAFLEFRAISVTAPQAKELKEIIEREAL